MSSIVSTPSTFPYPFLPPLVEVKSSWGGSWSQINGLNLDEFSWDVGAGEHSLAVLHKRYGDTLKLPGESTFNNHPASALDDYFVRISVPDWESGNTYFPQFVGRIYNDVKELKGSASRAIGHQKFTAYGPKAYLQKIEISQSFWLDTDLTTELTIGWLPPMNKRDKRGLLVGNRSSVVGSIGAYLYGGTAVFTHRQYLDMVLERYVNATGRPVFTVNDPSGVLDGLQTSIHFGEVTNVAAMLGELAPRKYGLDYSFNITSQGFEIQINPLVRSSSTFNGVTFPSNPNLVTIVKGNELDMIRCNVVRTHDALVDKFRVVGKRVVMCATLGGANALYGAGSLGPRWQSSDETDYKAEANDAARKRDYYGDVYRRFGPPDTWDHQGGALSPAIGLDGAPSGSANAQNVVRSTLTWLPLYEATDYTVDPAVEGADYQPETLNPLAVLKMNDIYMNDDSVLTKLEGYMLAEDAGWSLKTPHNDLGVLLHHGQEAAHALARNHWGSPEDGTSFTDPDDDIGSDYDDIMATIAWETDQRLSVGADAVTGLLNDGSTKTVHVDDAEMWILAANTVVGIDATGNLLTSGSSPRILRDDTARLNLVCAGEIARYLDERVRAEVTLRTWNAWSDLVGQILDTVEEAGGTEQIGAPITRIHWLCGGAPSMTIYTGYA